MDTNYLLKTADADPAYITVHTEGWRTGDRDTLAKLFDPDLADGVKPDEYKFRLYVHLETGTQGTAICVPACGLLRELGSG